MERRAHISCETTPPPPQKPTKVSDLGQKQSRYFSTDGAQEPGKCDGVGSHDRSRGDGTASGVIEVDCRHRSSYPRAPDKNSAPGALTFVQEWHNAEEQNGAESNMSESKFMQDGAPAQVSKKSQEWCRDVLPALWEKQVWQGSSPDLNALENLWEILQQELDNEEPCTNVQQQTERLKSAGANVPSATPERLVSGIPKRMSKCATLCGEHIGMQYKKNNDICCLWLAYERCKRTFGTPCKHGRLARSNNQGNSKQTSSTVNCPPKTSTVELKTHSKWRHKTKSFNPQYPARYEIFWEKSYRHVQGRTQDFLTGRARADIFLYSGQ